ncbi:jg13065, partial [Pararge aegeria aegeria]
WSPWGTEEMLAPFVCSIDSIMECSEELFALIPPSLFSDLTSRRRNKFHPQLTWIPGILLLFEIPDHFTQSGNNLPSDVFPQKYKGRINKFLKSRQRIGGSTGAADDYGRR